MATSTKTAGKAVKAKPVAATKAAAKPVAKPAAAKSVAKVAKPAPQPPAAKAASVAPVTKAKPAAAKKAAPAPAKPNPMSTEQRQFYVEVAAYYIAERRGFHGGSEFNDWVAAEAEIDRLVREGILNS